MRKFDLTNYLLTTHIHIVYSLFELSYYVFSILNMRWTRTQNGYFSIHPLISLRLEDFF